MADRDAVAFQRIEVQRSAVEDALAREGRVHRLAWPLLTANVELCRKTAPAWGLSYGNADTVGQLAKGLKPRHIEQLGWTEAPRVLSVAPGSPAAKAGLQPGDQIEHLTLGEADGVATPDLRALAQALKPARRSADKGDEVRSLTIRLRRGSERLEVTLEPVPACAVRLVSSPSNSLNASASFATITIHAGLLRALPDDNDVAFVMAHELAHVAGRHPRKVISNAALSGAGFWAPPALLVAQTLDTLTAGLADRMGAKTPPLTTAVNKAAASVVKSQAFEQEADYVGLYMHVRAGGSTQGLTGVFETFSHVSPRNSWLEVTHPSTPRRLWHLQAAAEEIEAKTVAGQPLVPNGWQVSNHANNQKKEAP